ncbi:MAG: hypothetical protein A2W25_17040 [candidate division Zixibacteria bacterium RBG_16_53_22]|nr:MAG: hypothetical protein A2W25_17040 [candidate division Zixibacteria bacterium RBG_16_53_22]
MLRRLLLIAALCAAIDSKADVVVRFRSNADMANVISLMMDGIESVKGDRSHSAVTISVDGGMMAMMGSSVPRETINIARLDKGLFWELDPQGKTFKESTVVSHRQQLSQGGDTYGEGGESDYDWTLQVTPSGEEQIVNGLACKSYLGKAVGIKKSNPDDSIFITCEQWLGQNIPASAEVKAFQARYADIVGVDQIWAQENLSSMLKGFGTEFGILADSLKRYEGFQVKNVILIESSGAGLGESAGNTVGAMMGKNLEEGDSRQGGRIKVFSLTTEIISIEQGAIDDAIFEIPEGYSKK